jgi:hypothetical protein
LDEHAIYLTETDDWVATAPTMRRALDYVCDLAGVSFHIEGCYGGRAMVFTDRRLWRPPETVSIHPLEGDAQSELMRLALDGRLKGFAAMPVRDWHKKTKKPRR